MKIDPAVSANYGQTRPDPCVQSVVVTCATWRYLRWPHSNEVSPMSVLSSLKLSTASPRARLTPVVRKRMKLLGQIDLQTRAAQAFLAGEPFHYEVQRWVRPEGSSDKQLVTQKKPVRHCWWSNEAGQLMISLRVGNRMLDLADGKPSIEVGAPDNLLATLNTLRDAIANGELDQQLDKLAARPIVGKKTAKA